MSLQRFVPLLALAACAPPDVGALQAAKLDLVDGGPATNTRFVEFVDGATDILRIALPTLEDEALSAAIIAAADRGVDVRVVTDIDESNDVGIVALSDAGVPLQLADDALTYFDFSFNLDFEYTSDLLKMSHAFALRNEAPMGRCCLEFLSANQAGDVGPGTRIVYQGLVEEIGEDMASEFTQVYGGTDASATNAFNAPMKSIADFRWSYGLSGHERVELWFGPQERPTKRIIDAVYGARSSIWIATEDTNEEGLARALQEKARDGFDVRIVLGAGFGTANNAQSRLLETDTPDVQKRFLPAGSDPIPTLVLVDLDDPEQGAQGMWTTMPIWSASRLYRGSVTPTDQLTDMHLWTLDAWEAPLTGDLVTLQQLYTDLEAKGE